jgi:hypothetical protein
MDYIYNLLFGENKPKKNKKQIREKIFDTFEMSTPEELGKTYGEGILDILGKVGTVATLINPPSTIPALLTTVGTSKAIEKGRELTFKGGFTYHGKYGGPSYSAGRFYKPGELITIDDIDKNPPEDALDALYLKHDLRYQEASTYDDPQTRKQKTREADEIFIREAEDLAKTQKLDLKTLSYLKGSVIAFKAKLLSDVGYNVDQISDQEKALETYNKYFKISENKKPLASDLKPSNFIIPEKRFNFNDLTEEQKIDLINFILEDE